MRDKYGNYLTFNQYIQKWKTGIQNITPIQQTNIQIRSNWIILVGISGGIITSLFAAKTLWWLVIILTGALLVTITQQLGAYQKKRILDTIEKEVNSNEFIQR